jgi:hypothetical protein
MVIEVTGCSKRIRAGRLRRGFVSFETLKAISEFASPGYTDFAYQDLEPTDLEVLLEQGRAFILG